MKRTVVTYMLLLSSLSTEAGAGDPEPADEGELSRFRRMVERKEEEEQLRERLAVVERRRRLLEAGEEESKRGNPHPGKWARRGRIILSEVAGIRGNGLGGGFSSSGILSVESLSTEGGTKATSVAFHPSIDVLVTEHLTLGGSAEIGRRIGERDSGGYSLGLSPRVGLLAPLGPVFLWPKVEAGVAMSRYSYGTPEDNSPYSYTGARTLTRAFQASAKLDLLVPLHRFVVFTVGPEVSFRHVFAESPFDQSSPRDTDLIGLGMRASIGLTF